MRQELDTRIPRADADAIDAAARLLRAGRLVAFPTETVYGLGADASSSEAVAKIYAAKGRPSFNPLIAHVGSMEAARREARLNDAAEALARAFWPGPLTIVAPRATGGRVCDLACAGLGSVAVRVPAHPVARALIAAAGVPIAAPSANRSGRVSPTTAAHVAADLAGRIDLILDGGAATVGLESTIVACLPDATRILRPGGIASGAIARVLAQPADSLFAASASVIAPGMLASHYAPRASLRLDAHDVAPEEAALDFGGALARWPAQGRIDLSPEGDIVEAAARLFGALRSLDALGVSAIAVAPIPRKGLGEAIHDRLTRAAAERP